MKDSLGGPALFLERVYPDNQYSLDIKKFAKERAQSLGLKLYEYDDSSEIILQSDGNISLFEYEDAGVGVTNGVYSVNAKLVE